MRRIPRSRIKAPEKEKDLVGPSFMPMPDGCGRGAQPVFGGVTCVDTIICEFYCTEECQVYRDYCEKKSLAYRSTKRSRRSK